MPGLEEAGQHAGLKVPIQFQVPGSSPEEGLDTEGNLVRVARKLGRYRFCMFSIQVGGRRGTPLDARRPTRK